MDRRCHYAPTRVVASVDVGKVNMAVCVARIRACMPDSTYMKNEMALCTGPPVLGDWYPDERDIRKRYPPMDIEWEGVHYAVRIVRWGVYSLRSDESEAAMEERTGRRAKHTPKAQGEGKDDETIESLVPLLVRRASAWLDAWYELGVTDICIEQQVALGGAGPPGVAMYGSVAGNIIAKVLSHVLQTMCIMRSTSWNVHFMSPRLTNVLADHIRGEKRPAKGVKKQDKKKFAVEAVSILMERHHPPLSGIFARATKSKRDDLSDSFLQALRFVRDKDGVVIAKSLRGHAKRKTN